MSEWESARGRYAQPSTRVDRAVDGLADRLALLLYRAVEVRGDVPGPTGAELVLVNHGGGFSDPLVLIAAWPRLPRFVARDVLWQVPVARGLMRAIRAVPVHRREDRGTGDNTGAFVSVAAALAAGQSVAIFPEGDSVDEPRLHPLRTGAARMALAGLAAGADVRVVPVGVHYRDKTGLRSSVLVQVGTPVRVATLVERLGASSADDRTQVRALTEAFETAMRPLVPGYRSWDLARDLQDAAAVALRPIGANPLDGPAFRSVVELADAIAAAGPHQADEVAAALDAYRRELALVGLTDAEVAASGSLLPALRRRLVELALALPLAAVGLPGNAVGYAATTAAGRLPVAPATMATVKPLAATLLFPAGWAWWAARSRHRGPASVLARLLLAPAGLAAGVLVAERVELAARVITAWARRDTMPAENLPALRRRLVAAVEASGAGAP